VGFARVSGSLAASCLTAVLDVVERFRLDSSSFRAGASVCDGVDTDTCAGAGVGSSSGSTMGAGRRCAVLKSKSTMDRKQNVLCNIEILPRR
jgi:hypothetical protein